MGQVAVVTGASSGIGEAFAERLAADGWDLVLVARRLERLEKIASRLGDDHGCSIEAREADLGDRHALGELCSELGDMPVGLLVNNAALAHYMPFAALPPESAEELVELNALAPVLLTRAVLPGMIARGAGAVINVASLLAFSGAWDAPSLPSRAVYAASKSFLVTFTEILATELRDTGVRAQVVCPGVVRSEFHSRQGMDLSSVPRMEPDAVAEASLLDLERGVVISIPGAEDTSSVDCVHAAERELLSVTRATELPGRYRDARDA